MPLAQKIERLTQSLILLSVCLISLVVSPVSYADKIKISGIVRCPYVCSQEDDRRGYIVDFASHILQQHGHTLVFKDIPWSRALNDAKRGALDGLAGVYFRNVPSFIIPKSEQGFSELYFFVRQESNWRFEGFNSLQQVSIGITQDVSYGPIDSYIRRYKGDPKYIQTLTGRNTLSRSVAMLLKKRVDASPADLHVMRYFLHKTHQTKKLKIAGSLSGDNLYLAFSPKQPRSNAYANLIAQGMGEMRKTGQLSTILKKYGLKDWKASSK